MTFGQVAENLMAAVQLASVSFCVVFVDPWVANLGALVFELNLQEVTIVSDDYQMLGPMLTLCVV